MEPRQMSADGRAAPQQITVDAIGKPVALSGLARILLRMHHEPRLTLVHDELRNPVPALEQGPQ
jgi:hypothetical protein